MGWILVQSLNKHKRVRLLDSSLTPIFEYHTQAFAYCKHRNINNCDIINVQSEAL